MNICSLTLLIHLSLFGSYSETTSSASAIAKLAMTAVAEDPKPIKIRLALVNNSFGDKAKMALTLINTGTEPLPATGWKLFFNGFAPSFPNASLMQGGRVNGDLQYLQPGTAFNPIAPGDSATVEIGYRRVRNRTDFPLGFYLVFDNKPATAIPVELTIDKRDVFAKTDQQLAERIYEQNAAIQTLPANKLPTVFPTPASYRETGQSFAITKQTAIVADKDFTPEAGMLANALTSALGVKPVIESQAATSAITLRKKAGLAPEGYELQIDANGVTLSATTRAGMFYAVQSLQTLLPAGASAKAGSVSLPGMVVQDAPRFPYRALMLDVARNFQPKAEVLKVLDVMGLYKMNTLHLHFSDDEGWRVEMPSLPELTTVGGTRAYSPDQKQSILPSYGSGPNASNTSGTGFYSKADFVEILRYASDRHITVIPEIESPGHARAALRAMDARYERLTKAGNKPEAERYLLRDLADKSKYESVQNFNDNVIDVSLPSVYNFMERVVDDLRAMYKEANAPLQTIHFGGDEVPAGVWQKSPSVQRLIAQNPAVKSADDLWQYYFGRLNQIVKSRGLYVSGWEEAGMKKVMQNGRSRWVPNPAFAGENFHLNVWLNIPGSGAEDLAYRLANAGYKVILTPVTHLYLDMAYNVSSDEPGQYWGGYVDIDKPFYFIPYNYLRNLKDDRTASADRGKRIDPAMIKGREALTAKGRANIVGMEAPLWSEKILSTDQLEYKLFPKFLAVAERAWAKDPVWATEPNDVKSEQLYGQAWSEFINVVSQRELPRLDTYAGGFVYRVPTAGVKVVGGKLMANTQFPGMIIRYTTNGTEPTATSPVYTSPIDAIGTIKLNVFTPAGRNGDTVTLTY